MSDEIEFKPLVPVQSELPRYPRWEVTVTEIGCTRKTIMTQAEFDTWMANRWRER